MSTVVKPIKIPSKVKIGSQVYSIYERHISEDAGLSDSHAYTYTHGNFIVMNKDLNVQLQRRYLMHELLHAIVHVFGQNDKSGKEDRTDTEDNIEHWFVYLMQEPMVMLLRENPDLVKFMIGNDI